MSDIITKLNEFYSIKELDSKSLKLLLSCEKDGQYIVGTTEELKNVDSETRFDALWGSTYHACKLLLSYYRSGHKEVYEKYLICLQRSLGMEFGYEGYLSEVFTLRILKELLEQGLLETIPTNSEEMKKIDGIIDKYRSISDDNPTKEILKELLKIYDKNIIFTYGTLMKNNSNHHYLKDDEYVGDSILKDYGLLELGYFPGAIKVEGYKVNGELYKVNDEEKKNIDYLEGNLYAYKKVFMVSDGKLYYVGFYEYNYPKEKEMYKLRIPYGKWNKEEINIDNYVWYICYGSNLSYRRFIEYINKCNNKNEPITKEPIILPYNIYFAGHTNKWKGAKAFLNTNENGKSYCVKYLITKEQFITIKEAEGKDYKTLVDLGSDKFGIKQCSFTATHNNFLIGKPSDLYLEEIKRGIRENYILSEKEIDNYLNK